MSSVLLLASEMEYLPRDCLLQILLALEVDDLVIAACVRFFAQVLEERSCLALVCKRHRISPCLRFNTFRRIYDQRHPTTRCLAYHNVDACIRYFCLRNDLEGVKRCLTPERINWKWVRGPNYWLSGAVEAGSLELVKFFVEKYNVTKIEYSARMAIRLDHRDILEYFFNEYGMQTFGALRKSNRPDLMEHFREKARVRMYMR